jgi:hypothetical protein
MVQQKAMEPTIMVQQTMDPGIMVQQSFLPEIGDLTKLKVENIHLDEPTIFEEIDEKIFPYPKKIIRDPSPPSYDEPFLDEKPHKYQDKKEKPDPDKFGGLEVYEDYHWEVTNGTSERDEELLRNWNTTEQDILDLALVMDLTGSMSDWIENTKDTLKQVIDAVVENNKNLEVRVAFVGYRDFPDDEIFTVHDFTFDIAEMKGYISTLDARGGADSPEDVAGGLHQLLQLSWHPNSTRLASLVADAPSHGLQYKNCDSDSTKSSFHPRLPLYYADDAYIKSPILKEKSADKQTITTTTTTTTTTTSTTTTTTTTTPTPESECTHRYPGDDYPLGSPTGLVLEEVVRKVREEEISLTCYKLEDDTERMFRKIQAAYGEGGVFTFVDLRRVLEENIEQGFHSKTSEYVQEKYYESVAADLDYRFTEQKKINIEQKRIKG